MREFAVKKKYPVGVILGDIIFKRHKMSLNQRCLRGVIMITTKIITQRIIIMIIKTIIKCNKYKKYSYATHLSRCVDVINNNKN